MNLGSPVQRNHRFALNLPQAVFGNLASRIARPRPRMATADFTFAPHPTAPMPARAVPAALLNACFVLGVLNAAFFPAAFMAHWWIIDAAGRGYPTDFINVYAAGLLARDGLPAQAWDWDVQKQVQVAVLGQSYPGHFAWHYPPPFLFVARGLAHLPYVAAYIGWAALSFVPYALAMRAIVGRPLGWLLAAAFPVVLTNGLVGQNGCLTASLIGGCLILLPTRPVLAGICLGLLSYKPQYGVLFPLVLIATSQWRAVLAAGMTVLVLAAVATLAFGVESWQAFAHWIPMASQAFLVEGRAPWFKMQSVYAMVRFLGGGEQLGWALQGTMAAAVATAIVVLWRSRVRYALKAAGLACGTLLMTPYLFLYDMMVLAIAIGFLVRLGLAHGFLRHELAALGLVAALLLSYIFLGIPTGLVATLIVAILIARRCGLFCRRTKAAPHGAYET